MNQPSESRKKRFLLVKLEDRIVPAHLPGVRVPDVPGIGVAQITQPHIDFQAVKASGGSNALSGGGGSLIVQTALCSNSLKS